MKYGDINLDKVRTVIKSAGLTEREFVKKYYDKEESHGMLEGVVTTNIGIKKLIKICNMLHADINSFFDIEDDGVGILPHITGNNNNVNSTVIQNDNTALKGKVKALEMVIDEKNQRISDLKKMYDNLISIIQLGQNSGTK